MPRQRYQMPTVMKTTGKKPQWYIRPWVDMLTNEGKLNRQPKRIYLGPVAEMGKRQAQAKRNEIMATINRADSSASASHRVRFSPFSSPVALKLFMCSESRRRWLISTQQM